jgi:pimeloyl-ACP methyl ester carboxylesterase
MTAGAQTWVLLRGLVREQRHWETFPQQLAACMPQARIVCIDLPGNGRRCQERSPAEVGAMVESARASLAGMGVHAPCALLAVSLGGMVAFEWMSRYPQEITRAVVINSSLRAFSPFWHRLRPGSYPVLLAAALAARQPEIKERRVLALTTNLVTDLAPVAQRWAAFARENPVAPRNALAQLLAAARYSAPAAPPSCPVLVMSGGNDRLVNPACSERIAAAFAVPLECHAQGGHDLTLDAGEWVAARVAAFAARTTA